jgi:hypothetical protein
MTKPEAKDVEQLLERISDLRERIEISGNPGLAMLTLMATCFSFGV